MEKKNTIKISLTTFIFIIALFILIIIGLIYFIIVNNKEDNKVKVTEINNVTEDSTENNTSEAKNSIYPEEMPEELDIQPNTYIAFSNLFNNNKGFDGEKYFDEYYMLGDYSQQLFKESNYMQYINSKSNIEKYNDEINIKLVPFDSWLENCAFAREIRYDSNIYEKSIEEIAKYQAEVYPKCHDYEQELEFGVTGMLIMNGNNKSEEEFYNNSRAKVIKITFNGTEEKTYQLQDTMDIQLFTVDYVQKDTSKPIDIKIEVLGSYSGNLSNDIYISDIQFGTYFSGTHGI